MANLPEWRLLPLHSMVPPNEQNLVFQPVPENTRKIIVSTNLAETSITIEDVVFVIDTGLNKGTLYEPDTNIASLETLQVSKANVQQRRGRAGRCRPGCLFQLFSKKLEWEQMKDFEKPEMQRTPVEELCLQVKALQLSATASIAETLSKAIAPPEALTVKNAVELLMGLGALEEGRGGSSSWGGSKRTSDLLDNARGTAPELLTPLGWKLSLIPCHPSLGKMLLLANLFSLREEDLTDHRAGGGSAAHYGNFLSSTTGGRAGASSSSQQQWSNRGPDDMPIDIQPDMLSICATLGFKTPFTLPFGKEKEADAAKKEYGWGLWGDHLLFSKVAFDYLGLNADNDHTGIWRFCDRNFLSQKTLEMSGQMRSDLLTYLKDLKLVQRDERLLPWDAGARLISLGTKFEDNLSAKKRALLQGVLSASLHLARKSGWDKEFQSVIGGAKCDLHPGSLISDKNLYKRKNKQPGLWMVCYFDRMRTSSVYLRDNTLIHDSLPLFLLAPQVEERGDGPAATGAASSQTLFELQDGHGTCGLLFAVPKAAGGLLSSVREKVQRLMDSAIGVERARLAPEVFAAVFAIQKVLERSFLQCGEKDADCGEVVRIVTNRLVENHPRGAIPLEGGTRSGQAWAAAGGQGSSFQVDGSREHEQWEPHAHLLGTGGGDHSTSGGGAAASSSSGYNLPASYGYGGSYGGGPSSAVGPQRGGDVIEVSSDSEN